MTEQEFVNHIYDGRVLVFGPSRSVLVDRLLTPVPNSKMANVLRSPLECPREIAQQLIDRRTISALTEFGYPPPGERRKGQGFKKGWKEMGLPTPSSGEAYYLLSQ